MKILSTLILIATMSITTHASSNNIIVTENASVQQAKDKANALKQRQSLKQERKKRDAYPGVEWKPKNELDKDRHKYPGVEWKPTEGQNKYPGVEWKPKEGDPRPNENRDAYPGVEWTPKK